MSNEITELAAKKDATFGFTGKVDIVSVGGNTKASIAAQSMIAAITTGLAVGAAAGYVDPGLVGIAGMSAAAGRIGWKL